MESWPKETIKSYLKDPILLRSEQSDLDMMAAREMAREKALEQCDDPMLLAWYNGQTGDYVPKAECSKFEQPPWIIYAYSRGGNITVDINDEEFVFIYLAHNKPVRKQPV